MSRPIADHGTPARYKGRKNVPGCRCRPCTKAASKADAERRVARLSGNARSADAVMVQRVLEHLRYLVSCDMSHAQIGQSAGVAQSTVSQLLSGQRKNLMSSTAGKLLGVRVTDRTETCMVSAVGAMRRLRALYWMGHPSQNVAAETGLHEDTVLGLARGRWEKTTAARVQAVCRAYDKLAMAYGTSEYARRFAVTNGWHGPLAWDDDTIDDPYAIPQLDAARPDMSDSEDAVDRWLMGESVVLGPDARKRAILHLFEWTDLTVGEIAARVEMTPAAAEQIWYRLKKQARLEGRREPWRRVWALRDKNLTKNDMEEAA